MQNLNKLRDKLMDELISISDKGGELTSTCLETIYKLTESIKALDTISAMHQEGYSQTGNRYSYTRNPLQPGRYSRTDRYEMLEDELIRLRDNAPSQKAREAAEIVMAHLNLDRSMY